MIDVWIRLNSLMKRERLNLERRLYNAAGRHPLLARAKPLFLALEGMALWLERRLGSQTATRQGTLGIDIAATPIPGINVVGYLRAELGIGDVARKLIRAIEHARVPYSTITYHRTSSRQQFPLRGQAAQRAPYDTNLVCVNADQLFGFVQAAGPAFFADRYVIGVWFWEVDLFPKHLHSAFGLIDELWVASDFVRDALARVTKKAVKVVPLPLEAPPARPVQRTSLNLPDLFLFFFTFDFMSVLERKNPLQVIAAFKEAFVPGEGAALVVKSINGQQKAEDLKRLRTAAADHPDIYILDGYLAPEVKDGLMAACDCYVSLHRSEGLGLTMAEAMSYEKPVIATAYSGNLTFMDDENSYLVPYTLSEVPVGCDPYPGGARWAQPDLRRAAALMRHVFKNQEEARERGKRARNDIVTRHSIDRTAQFITNRLREIDGSSETGGITSAMVSSASASASRGR